MVTLGRHGGKLAVFRELNTELPPPSPVINGGHPLLPPPPGDEPRQVTGEQWVMQYGRHRVFLILQADCHGTDQFGGGTEKAPALSLVTHCQALDAQGESQADEFIRQGFNLICTVFTFE